MKYLASRLALGAIAVTITAVGLYAAGHKGHHDSSRLSDVNRAEVNLLRQLPVMALPPQDRKRFIASWGGLRSNTKVRCDWHYSNGDKLCKVYRTNQADAMNVRYRGLAKGFLVRVLRRRTR